jgi:glycerophosphoryl diester phosphodiesterase
MSTPFVVAHRAGNDLDILRRAEALGSRLVEADLHLRRGRVEVRHLKTLGPLPLLWDRWYLAPGWRPRLRLETLLDAVAPGTELLLDLKGADRRLSRQVRAALGGPGRALKVTVCARSWRLLEPLRGLPGVRLVHSVGSRRQLRALRRRFAGRRLAGISIHRQLLDPVTVTDLRTRAELLITWPISTEEEARRLGAWGVDGVITERFEALAPALAEAAA